MDWMLLFNMICLEESFFVNNRRVLSNSIWTNHTTSQYDTKPLLFLSTFMAKHNNL